MSKIGKKNILIPKESSIKIEGGNLTISGPKGTKKLTINEKIFSSKLIDSKFEIQPLEKKIDKKTSIMWGTYRSLINNAVTGVSKGHEKILELSGVGFRANLKGEILNLQIGFSHDVNFQIPKDIKISVEKQTILKISGVDKDLVSKIAADIKNLKPVEPYKAKGIKEKGQFVLRKEGKKNNEKINNKIKTKLRNRKKLKKVSFNRFRVSVSKSLNNISAQIIDDKNKKTLVSASSIEKEIKSKKVKKMEKSSLIGEILAKRAKEKNINEVYFDRGAYKYHGRVKLFAETLRKNGLKF